MLPSQITDLESIIGKLPPVPVFRKRRRKKFKVPTIKLKPKKAKRDFVDKCVRVYGYVSEPNLEGFQLKDGRYKLPVKYGCNPPLELNKRVLAIRLVKLKVEK